MDTQNPNQDTPGNTIPQTDYTQPNTNTVPTNPQTLQNTEESMYTNMAKNITWKTWSGNPDTPPAQAQPKPQPMYQPTPITTAPQADDGIQAFSSHAIAVPSVNIFGMIGKVLSILIPSIPVILILIAFIMFLFEKNFDITQISVFPGWITTQIETLVKQVIIPNIQSNNL